MMTKPKTTKKLAFRSSACSYCGKTNIPIYLYETPVCKDDHGNMRFTKDYCCESCGDNAAKEMDDPTFGDDRDLF